jgi:hypothetical protein
VFSFRSIDRICWEPGGLRTLWLEDVVLKAEELIKSRSSEFVEVEITAEKEGVVCGRASDLRYLRKCALH